MNDQPWVKRKYFDGEEMVQRFLRYESAIQQHKPSLYQSITNGKSIRNNSLNIFCVNKRHIQKVGTWDQDSSSKHGLFQKHNDILSSIEFPFV